MRGSLAILCMSTVTLTTWQSQALYSTSPEFLAHYSRSYKVYSDRQSGGGGGGVRGCTNTIYCKVSNP